MKLVPSAVADGFQPHSNSTCEYSAARSAGWELFHDAIPALRSLRSLTRV